MLVPDSGQAGEGDFYGTLLGVEAGTWQTRDDRVSRLNWEHPLFDGVFGKVPDRPDLPRASAVLRMGTQPRQEVLATLQNGGAFLSATPVGEGVVFAFHADLDPQQSNFMRHALWVPTWLRIAERSRATPVYALTLGSAGRIRVAHNAGADLSNGSPLRLVPLAESGSPLLPSVTPVRGGVEIDVPEALRISGNYRLDSGGETWAVIGVNHDRRESDPEPFSPSEWQAQLETNGWKSASVWEATESTVGNLVQRFERGQPHWQWMIAFALMALLLETLLLRPWKKTS